MWVGPDATLFANVSIWLLAALLIILAGTRLAGVADRLADRTGLGEALVGATLLGGSTSLPGITASVTAAWAGHPSLAISNALGGIAAQTAFLGVADFFHRRVNLEHAAVSVPNLLNGVLLVALLGGVLLAGDLPPVAIAGVSPMTPLLFLGYLFGLRLARESHRQPQWWPRKTAQTRPDIPDPANLRRTSLAWLWGEFALCALTVAVSGWLVAHAALGISAQTGLTESVVGGVFTAISTSTPELVTTIAAIRRGALTLAVGGVLGGNAFDVMFAVAADVAYREGSIYHAISHRERFLAALTIVLTSVLVMGMLARQKRGPANIGFESLLILLFYLVGMAVLLGMG
jgi:cation:H+ antiporter